jgi:hypothetical protein
MKFFQPLGSQLEFDSDHNPSQLRDGDGLYWFSAEVPESRPKGVQLVLPEAFHADPIVDLVSPFGLRHWGTKVRVVCEPDGPLRSLQAAST